MSGDVYFWRQVVVLIADCLHQLSIGFILPFPSILNPAILSPNTTDIKATKEQASWINSIYGVGGIVGFCIIPSIMQSYGRKVTFLGLNLVVTIGFIIIVFAENVETIYVARIIQGLSMAGAYITSIIQAEYSHPKRRGYFISLQKGAIALGSLICHTLVLACTWRQIAGIATISTIISIAMTLPWAESPAYFAMKGRYEDCERSFIYIYGDTPRSRKELNDLISAQAERREKEKIETKKSKKSSSTFKKLLKKDFLKPFFIIALLTLILNCSGRYFNLVFIVQIIADITGNNSLAIFCSIGLDFLTVVSSLFSSLVLTRLRRRTILISFGGFSVALIFLISIIVYLKSNNIMADIVWLVPSIILLNSFIINIGLIPACFAITGEIFPLEHRGTGTTASGIIFTLLFAISMKFTPIVIEKTGVHGTYGINGLFLVICVIILYFILPETKDKTLQQIEDELKDTTRGELSVPQELKVLVSA